ncbi:hypothetical protein [Streptacidiphilus fuscans]|uniref:Uncharacterized protein n=1 Tax=Streptacidiphilus fuscans TaxID=2789292 RepID=A0A931AXE0_9ACTN|nr:hypothetical protein [Streptacidiphilus fuscans]MBF9066624.1 hypothetical protein [Streptacidiphilus fuscans]
MSKLAAETSARSGTPVRYHDLPQADYASALTANGVPQASPIALVPLT